MKYIDKTSEASKNRAQRLEKWVEDYRKKFSINPDWKKFKKRRRPLNGYDEDQLRLDLWEEQGGICCYCGQKIPKPTEQHGTVCAEHIMHKSVKPDLALVYTNLILSCMGREYTIAEKGETLNDVENRINNSPFSTKIFSFDDMYKNQDAPIVKEGDIVFLSNIPDYCNEKRNDNPKPIIDPTDVQYNTAENDCWRLFSYQYDADKRPAECKIEAVNNSDELTKNTYDVLGLDCVFLNRERGRLYEMFENSVLFIEDEDGNTKPRKKSEIKFYLEERLKTPYHFCSMDYSIILQNL